MAQPLMGDGALVALFNGISLVLVAFLQYRTKKDVKENTEITKDNTSQISDTKERVEQVHQLANGRLTEVIQECESLKKENDRLRAELGHRRASDT